MKKVLFTFLGIAAGISSFKASAQLALETFDHGGALPTGWTMQSDGHTVNTALFGGGLPALVTALDANAWYPVSSASTGFGGAGDYQMITTSDFTPSATADRWIMSPAFNVTSADMVIQWDDNDLGSGETMEVLASATASTVTSTYVSLYSAPAGAASTLTTHQLSIGAYNGTSIRIAFRDNTTNNWGMLLDNVQTAVLSAYDLGVTSLSLPAFVQTGSNQTVTGVLQNYGITTTTSLNINYSINGGAPVTTAIPSGLSIPLGGTYAYTSGTPWNPTTAGAYTVKVWADNINGNVDQNHTNDTFTAVINVLDSLQPKTVMIEEFNQASCDPCAQATPNLDSVYINNLSQSIMVRYHVNFPGRDCMDSVTLNPFVNAMLSYYNVSGVPDAQVDGQYVYPGAGYFTSSVIQSEVAQGSPFKIVVNPSYDAATETYSFSATITSYANIGAGLVARAALTIDTITYAANQSTESIPQTVFPEVAENMFPSAAGQTLGAFTTGSSQTITSSWVKNHRWGSDYAVWKYDSTLTGKIVVWVSNNTTQNVYQAGYAPVSVGTTGINAVVADNGSMDIYPNPAKNVAIVALNLKSTVDVKIEVYNMAGQVVFTTQTENRNAGNSSMNINTSDFASGDYIVRVSIGNEVLNKKLTITK